MVKAVKYKPYKMNDPFVTCPYYSVHRVPLSRLQQHLIKCQWRKPALHPCPYNATHRYTMKDIVQHVVNCPSKPAVSPADHPTKPVPTPFTDMLKACADNCSKENWDD